MSGSGDFDSGRILAMAKGKSPWGGDGDPAQTDPPVSDGEGGDPPADEPAPKAKDDSRNPWLPPHADEPARRSANIEDIFRARGGRGGGTPAPGTGRNWLPLVLAGLVAAWIGGTSVHVLAKGEQGLVTTLGHYQRTAGPGLALTLPWPLQAATTRNTARIEETVLPAQEGENLMLTRDRQLVDFGFKLRWRVTDLQRFAYASPSTAAVIADITQAQALAAVAEVPLDGLIEGQRRAELQQRVASRSQAVFDTLKLGVRIEGAEVTRAEPPAKVAEAFRKVGLARQEARKTVAKAQTFVQQTLQKASNEAAEFESVYLQYQAAPEITRKRRYYETMERVLSANPTVIVAGNGVSTTVAPAPVPTKSGTPATPATGGQ